MCGTWLSSPISFRGSYCYLHFVGEETETHGERTTNLPKVLRYRSVYWTSFPSQPCKVGIFFPLQIKKLKSRETNFIKVTGGQWQREDWNQGDTLESLCFFTARGGLPGKAQRHSWRKSRYGRPRSFLAKAVKVIKILFITCCKAVEQLFTGTCETPLIQLYLLEITRLCHRSGVGFTSWACLFAMYWAVPLLFINLLSVHIKEVIKLSL